MISSQKKWMYLSFALMGILASGILASGILAPAAFATSPTLTDILNKIVGVDTKTSAINTKVDTMQGQISQLHNSMLTKIVEKGFTLSNSNTVERIVCDSDKPFIVHVGGADKGSANNRVDVFIQPDVHDNNTPVDGVQIFNVATLGFSQTMGGDGNHQFELFASGDSGSALEGIITMQTAEGANASCVVV